MKTIYQYVLPTMADWEPGYAIAELQSQRYFKRHMNWKVKTVAATKVPIVTMGGVTIMPDASVAEMHAEDVAMLILPGADTWADVEHQGLLNTVKEFLDAGIPVAAICGATGALAAAGLLDERKHTSNGLPYLNMVAPNYKGAKLYQDELAVTDDNLITAGSSAPVEFAYHIFKKLQVMEPQHLEYWYGYFGKHSIGDFLKLFEAMHARQS